MRNVFHSTALYIRAFLLGMAGPGYGQVREFLFNGSSQSADRLSLSSAGNLVWKDYRPGPTTRLVSTGLDGSASVTYPITTVVAPFYVPAHIPGGIDQSGGVPYFVDSTGEVRSADQAIVRTPDPARITTEGQISLSSGNVFWTEESMVEELIDGSRLFVAPRTPGGTPELVVDYFAAGLLFKKLAAVSDARVMALLNNGRLMNYSRVPGLPGSPANWQQTTIASDATAMCLQGSRIHWACRAGSITSFYYAPISGTPATVSLGTISFTGSLPINEMAVTSGNIYYQVPLGGGGELFRRSAEAAATPVPLGFLDHRPLQMCASGRYVCWIRDDRQKIMQIAVGAATVTRNLVPARAEDAPASAPFLEVIQAVQTPLLSVPLVEQKRTHVRAFGRIAASAPAESAVPAFPPMVLHGRRGDADLPGSPLFPISSAPSFTPSAGRRIEARSGYWFELPESWTEGTITLQSEVNPSHSLSETHPADNRSPEQSASFVPKVPIGVHIVPTSTHAGMIRRDAPGIAEFFTELEALLPTSDLRYRFSRADSLAEDQGFGVSSPFEFRPDDDDAGKVLLGLFWKKVFNTGRGLAEPGGFDHYMALLPASAREGVGYASDAWEGGSISLTMAPLLVFQNGSRDINGNRRDVLAAARALAHNNGRAEGGCTMLAATAPGAMGFNPFTGRVLGGISTPDFMGDCDPAWVSPETWTHVFNRVNTGTGPAARIRPRGVDPVRNLVSGVLDAAGRSTYHQGACLLDASGAAAVLSTLPPLNPAYQLRAWLGTTPIAAFPVYSRNAGGELIWMSVTGSLTGVDRLELTKLSTPLAPVVTIKGGGSAPVVNITSPAAGALYTGSTLPVDYTYSDDGLTLFLSARYSNDNGTSWKTVDLAPPPYVLNTADLPGGGLCRIEVSVSDGILCTVARSGAFYVPNKAPELAPYLRSAYFGWCAPEATPLLSFGSRITLVSGATDVEDGRLADGDIAWRLTGPINKTGMGWNWRLNDLPPGNYSATCSAEDRDGTDTSASLPFVIGPAYIEEATEGATIDIDGIPSELRYTSDPRPKVLGDADGATARVRMIHSEGALRITASGLRTGAHPEHRFTVGFDMDHSGGPPGGADLLVNLFDHGVTRIYRGNGTDWVHIPAATDVSGSVSGDAAYWSVEISIPDTRFTSWDGRAVRCILGALDRTAAGDNAVWPPAGNLRQLHTWAETVLGGHPEDPADRDFDGLADGWEDRHFGSLLADGSADTDGDGQDDAAEFIAGTDPRSDRSTFRATSGLVRGQIIWNTAPGRTYTVMRSSDMRWWLPVASHLPDGGTGTGMWNDPSPPAGRAFYRVEAFSCR